MTYKVTVSYDGPTGRHYTEPYTLDLSHMEGTLMGETPLRRVVEDGFEKLNKTLDQWSSGFRPLQIVDRTEDDRDNRDAARWRARFFRARAEKENGPA